VISILAAEGPLLDPSIMVRRLRTMSRMIVLGGALVHVSVG